MAKVITFKLTEDQLRALDYHASMLRLDRSKLIRFILDEYLHDQRLVELRIRRDFERRHGYTAARGEGRLFDEQTREENAFNAGGGS